MSMRPKARFGRKLKEALEAGKRREDYDGQVPTAEGSYEDASSEGGKTASIGSLEDALSHEEIRNPHLYPKVMVAYETRPGEVPRRVIIERRKRLYDAQDLNSLIVRETARKEREDPAFRRQRIQRAKYGPPVFPLEIFDDCELETRTPQEWVPSIALPPGAPAPPFATGRMARMDDEEGVMTWRACTVEDWDAATGHFKAVPKTGPGAGVGVWVPRIDLHFDADDPFVFARRRVAAEVLRERSEAALLHALSVDEMPTEALLGVPRDVQGRVMELALNSKRLQDRTKERQKAALLAEMDLDFRTATNRAMMGQAARVQGSAVAPEFAPMDRAVPKEMLVRVEEDPEGAAGAVEPTPVDCPAYCFPDQFSDFAFYSLLTQEEVITAVMKIRVENAKVLKQCLFTTHATKGYRADEFQQLQGQTAESMSSYLRDTWCTSIKNIVKSSFRDVGKGWFNLEETNRETYEFSKLRRFLTLTRLMMEDVLRFLVESSLQSYVKWIRGLCAAEVVVRTTKDVEVTLPDGDGKAAGTKATPLFVLELEIDPATNTMRYNTPTEKVAPSLVKVFDQGIAACQGIAQLEPQVLERLLWSHVPPLNTPHPREAHIVALREELTEAVERALEPARAYLAEMRKYEEVLQADYEAFVKELGESEELTLERLKAELTKAEAGAAAVVSGIPNAINLGLVRVGIKKVREAIIDRKNKLVAMLRDLMAAVPRRMMAEATRKFEALSRQLQSPMNTIEEVDAQRKFLEDIPKKVAGLEVEMSRTQEWYTALEELRYKLTDDAAKVRFQALHWPLRVAEIAARTEEQLKDDESQFREEMIREQGAFVSTIGSLESQVQQLRGVTNMEQLEGMAQQVAELKEALASVDEEAKLFNSREAIFGLDVSDYSSVKRIIDQFDPYLQFWSTARAWQNNQEQWMEGQWTSLDPDHVEREVGSCFKTLFKVGRMFNQRDLKEHAGLADGVRQKVEDFKAFVPLIQALRTSGMRDRHWDQLSEGLGFELRPGDDFTMTKAQEMGLLDHIELISKVADVAAKEYAIEQALAKMESEWSGTALQVMEYRETGTYVIKVDEAVSQMLDDQIVMAQSMSFSPYKKPFEARIHDWERQLNLMSEMIDEWLALQRQWMYLEPIFSSEDIQSQLPVEAKKFTQVDRLWRRALQDTHQAPEMLHACVNQPLLDQFREANKQLDSVQKGLADYLETKRLAFARFFFLSNDELLQILSQTKNPLAVQPHLRKCFEAIDSLDFGDGLEISAMNSREGEKVPFEESMYPQGNVEQWLGKVEKSMINAIRHQIILSMEAYEQGKRRDWVRSWPAMVVLAVNAIYWSRNAEQHIEAENVKGFLDKSVAELMDLTDLVRGHLSNLDRLTLGALITIDVHARDTVSNFVDVGLKSTTDFEWVSQLRYYWREDVYVDMVQASLPFGYEYLGNTPRLVITPLTDRCYMTLMSAMHMNLGGAPAGPAGTGKTETTKDLAKALAKQCVVFNCSDGLDYLAMAKMFKGLASSGAWACFDEFNRIDLEVLSVVAQQILTIQLAIQSKVKRFVFEETELDLNQYCSVFITMNPGYAGRSELPDNLKALFRPCAMMVPDYALIAEICLYSYGYRDAKTLSGKMVATFRLCSEQLSRQDHYDYGMRAVKSVITAAGNLKREYPDQPEDVLVLRGLRDVNVPKFLSHDLPLFDGIISDLFPGVKMPESDYTEIMGALIETCSDMNIQPADAFLGKVIQLYDTTIVRHGLMLVGPTMAGKTECYKALAKSMTKLRHQARFEKVQVCCLNPKSITMGQLYGEFDENTHEWTDGVLAHYMREFSAEQTPDKKWIMFDGPVDAVWIENMNTVLDDNKKLCLVSGEIIQMSDPMTMMFEVEDLSQASPATVSRCGMVYMEPSALGMTPLLESWLGKMPAVIASQSKLLERMFRHFVPELVHFVRRDLKETVATVDHQLCMSCFSLMDSLMVRYNRDETIDPLTKDEKEKAPAMVPALFLFSMVWSLGASCDKDGRDLFDRRIRALLDMAMQQSMFDIPEEQRFPRDKQVFDWVWDVESMAWMDWMDTQPKYECNPNAPFAEIIVPTRDTVRYSFVMEKLLLNQQHVLCVGDTGTGKTVTATEKLLNLPTGYDPQFVTFSARTGANQTQDLIDNKVEKIRKVHGTMVCGPGEGKKYVFLVDDMNMPQREKYGAQPPIELLRQWMDHGGWYERRWPFTFRQIINVQFVGSMGPPGGGRNPVTPRYLRHFKTLSFVAMSDESCCRIFNTILGTFLESKLSPKLAEKASSIVDATVEMYNTIRKELLPTPTRSHYTFNLRDMSRVVQGVMRAEPKTTGTVTDLLALWLHESARVFKDRLINDGDSDWFMRNSEELLKTHFEMAYSDIVKTDRLIYGDFMVPGADPRSYARITDLDRLLKVVEEYLDDYNSVSNAPMKLVMFLDAIEHVSRICRVIRLPLGNALLLGVGGSGRQSLTKLAAYMEEFEIFQIEIVKGYGLNEWRDNLKEVLKLAGMSGKDTVFLFSDTQIIMESFLEDLNNILNSGEVPNLMGVEDLEEIKDGLRGPMAAEGVAQTPANVLGFFNKRVRAQLHLVVCMSPIGDAFRQRLRMFPSLVNCCTIDWFREWPDEALRSVALSFYKELPLNDEANPDLLNKIVEACVGVHQSVERHSKDFFEQLRRYNYVTPTSYLELLTTFIKLLSDKRQEVHEMSRRLEVGLDKLMETEGEVQVMQKELEDLQPVLLKTSQEVEDLMVVITHDKKEADETRAAVEKQEADANVKAAEAQELKASAQKDLDEALPALDAAVESLKNLSRNDVVEVKSMANPPQGVRMVMEAACIMFQEKPKMVADPDKPGKKKPDYWENAKKMLSDAGKFLDALMTYDKDNIAASVIEKIQPYMQMEEFVPEAVARVSKAATSICMWVRAMYTYHQVALSVEPKRQALAKAEAELAETMEQLAEAQAKLRAVQDKIAELEASFDEATAKKEALSRQSEDCKAKLNRADKLLGGLGGEKMRWMQTVAQLREDLKNIAGDVVVSAGAIAYSGPFTPNFRTRLNQDWESQLRELGVPHTPGTNITKTLQDPVQVRAWNIAGLPTDQQSVENGIIVSKARRWPLMIDPQGQANKWIKNMEREKLDVIKLSDKDFLRPLENGVRFGRAVLLENIGEELDAALEPLLLKQTFKQGGQEVIKIGDNIIPYSADFRFYMTTKFRSPHYPPEVAVKVSLLNFFVTSEGLEEQLLGITVTEERPDLSEMKSQLVISNANMKRELKEIEDKILAMLSNSQGNILDDEELINTLAESKVKSNEIAAKVAEAEKTEKEIDEAREQYRAVAVRSSLLFFCISDLAAVDPMYQYSLTWFIALFVRAVREAERSDDIPQRGRNLNEYFTYSLYCNVCRSLFEKHKLMFSVMLVTRILSHRGEINAQEWRFLLAGPTDTELEGENPAPTWLTEKCWVEVQNMSRLPTLAGFEEHFCANIDHYRKLFDSSEAHTFPLAEDWNDRLSSFQKLLVLRCLRPDKLTLAAGNFVVEHLGQQFTEPPPYDLAACYREAAPATPLIFVLSPGADPMADLLKLSEDMRMSKKFEKVSLGQGQGKKAEQLLTLAMDAGMWVCLQNCHLAQSWMPTLERIVENINPETVNPHFRLWLTALPDPHFPVSILQNGVKVTLEPPKGLKSNLARSYARFNDQYLEESKKPAEWRRLLFGMCLFHAVIMDRRKFGALGWNIRYDFTDGDLSVSLAQMKQYLDDYESVPYRVLRFLFTEINYGGRVTDDKDRRLINTLVENFINPGVVEDSYKFSPSGIYRSIDASTVRSYLEYIKELPINPAPEIFGLHENADITCDQNETYDMLGTILSLQPRTAGAAGSSREDVIGGKAEEILKRVPAPFDVEAVMKHYPTTYKQSMNTVLTQECQRFNVLLEDMALSLRECIKALKGLVVMSHDLEAICNAIFDNRVPERWEKKAYPSLKPLSSWVTDLLERCAFIQGWIDNGVPSVYWISGFVFPQAFLTGTLQNFARKYTYPIDTVSFGFQVMDHMDHRDVEEGPEDGCYVRGLFLEGARWNEETHLLGESRPKELFTEMPVMWLQPMQNREAPEDGVYLCPMYKTLTRQGTLSTTGHSTNFVMMVELPTDESANFWICRGVACFCALAF
ncbi:unnamed protein product [Pedinophyceae sp. YPF-701]|nr:unnamed protein product [Pedinophyceae sp. YPF-701]